MVERARAAAGFRSRRGLWCGRAGWGQGEDHAWPDLSVKTAWVGQITVRVLGWYGLPQPGGGWPEPSLSGGVAS